MNERHVVYDKATGAVVAMLQINDPVMLALNTPDTCERIKTNTANIADIERVDPRTRKIKMKGQ